MYVLNHGEGELLKGLNQSEFRVNRFRESDRLYSANMIVLRIYALNFPALELIQFVERLESVCEFCVNRFIESERLYPANMTVLRIYTFNFPVLKTYSAKYLSSAKDNNIWDLYLERKRAEMGWRNRIPYVTIVIEAWQKVSHVAKGFCFLHVASTYLVQPVETSGPSMLPTIDMTASVFVLEKISTRFGKVACGDIVVVQSPQNPRKLVTKRVVGMEGDTVTYISDPKNNDKHETIVVPKGHVWVQGDNIYASTDSRDFGPVPYGLIQGKIFWRGTPLKYFGPFWNK
ncbi:hypothetical protein VNO77_39369 [Canavalia gladiata]|uniref:Peptidase S26 domain-containing protein n=1 Tax=Canavalia gladiata TaxID=3824 RepID=A0AAN9KAZ3_CANGL